MANKGSAGGQPTTTTSTYMAQDIQALDGSDEELTDLEEDLTLPPKKARSGIRRTYAVGNLAAPVWNAEVMYMGQFSRDEEYEPATEPERGSSAHEDEDDDPTPKKKQKVAKVPKEPKIPTREAVKASREEYDTRREQSKVSMPSMGGKNDTDQHEDCLIV